MKASLTAVLLIMAAGSAFPASASELASEPVSLSTDDLPLTDRFANRLERYRNCVLAEIEAAPLGTQQAMAHAAMSACALSRGELHAQLVSDIREAQPRISTAIAERSAESGLEQVDPMIEAAAVDWAHIRYARDMI